MRQLPKHFYATAKGQSYHASRDCERLRPDAQFRAMTRPEVMASKLKPCGTCRPGHLPPGPR